MLFSGAGLSILGSGATAGAQSWGYTGSGVVTASAAAALGPLIAPSPQFCPLHFIQLLGHLKTLRHLSSLIGIK